MFDIDPDDYDYALPERLIAQYPLSERDSSRLLVYRNGEIRDGTFIDLHEYLPPRSLLVFNNTKVIRARIHFRKETGASVEVFLLEPYDPPDYSLALSARNKTEWRCLVGNLKRWKEGTLSGSFGKGPGGFDLTAQKIFHDGDSWIIRFSWNNGSISFGEVIESAGHIPLPPYISREDKPEDAGSYQTIYSMVKGSVAAPTAGLHFTRRVFDRLDAAGMERKYLTLHVGAGTFQPVKSRTIAGHEMHTEHFFIERETIESVLKNKGNVIAVGTTSVRTLESLYWLGCKIAMGGEEGSQELWLDQWEPYTLDDSVYPEESLELILSLMERKSTGIIHVPTRMMIVPGYKFRMVDGMITNFHLPKSTLLLLVSAWTGGSWKRIYDHALGNNYRFLSYGDSSLLLK